jgi:hypothetical protein
VYRTVGSSDHRGGGLCEFEGGRDGITVYNEQLKKPFEQF